jgi:hypothetical protein
MGEPSRYEVLPPRSVRASLGRMSLPTPIPAWITALDDRKPWIDVLDGKKLPYTAGEMMHGVLVLRIAMQLDGWSADRDDRGVVAVRVRYYFEWRDGTWSALMPDVCYMSWTRFPKHDLSEESQRPRIAPDIAVEVLSRKDRPSITRRKVATFLEYGATVVLVLQPETRRVTVHRADGTSEERDARGTMPLAPYDDLALDWEEIFAKSGRR